MTSRRAAVRILALAGALGVGWALWIAATGSVDSRVLGLRIRSSSASRPFWIGAVAIAVAIWLHGPRNTVASVRRAAGRLTALHGVALLAVTTAVVSAAGNSWTASGPDAFAYVSQAALWREGQFKVPIPLAARAPWPKPIVTFTPWGYRAGSGGRRQPWFR